MIPRTIMISLLLFLQSSIAVATPISHDELIDGDLNDQVLNLDVGVNTITGTWTLVVPATIDVDSFFFNVPVDSAITEASLTFDTAGLIFSEGGSMFTRYVFFDTSSSPRQLITNFALPLPSSSSPQ